MEEEPRHGEFLPPKPAGPEPELGPAPARQPEAFAPPQYSSEPQPQGYTPQPTWQQQPQPAWGYAQQRPEPDNSPAVAGFVLSVVSGGLLVVTGGLSTIVSLACAIVGMVYARKGKQKIASGETTKNEGLAKAGWIVGIVALVFSVLAIVVWIIVLILAISDEDFRRDLEREFDNSQSIRAGLQVSAAAGRVLLG